MSGFGKRVADGLSWSLSGKSFLALDYHGFPEHPTLEFKQKNKSPYWTAKEPTTQYVYLDERGKYDPGNYKVGDINWQNDKTAITWNLGEFNKDDLPYLSSDYRYAKPFWFEDPSLPNKIYCKKKRSKSLSGKMIVGAGLWTKRIRRFLAITVDGDLENTEVPVNLALYATSNLPSNEDSDYGNWELVSELGSLTVGTTLETSFFFNQNANEAVAVIIPAGTGMQTNRRIMVSVEISSENVLSATMQIDNPFPSCTETGVVVTGGTTETATVTYTGLSLVACDYWYRPDLEPDANGNYDRLVYLVLNPGTSTKTDTINLEFTREVFFDPGTVDYYGLSSTLNEISVAGSIDVYYNGSPICSLPVNYTSSVEYSWSSVTHELGSIETYTSTQSNNRYMLLDCDLRGLVFFTAYLDTEAVDNREVDLVYPQESDPYTATEIGTRTFEVLRYENGSLTQLYAHQETINRSDSSVFPYYGYPDGTLPYLKYTSYSNPYNNYRGLQFAEVYYLGFSYAGSLKCIVKKKPVSGNYVAEFPIFMSSSYIKYGEADPYPQEKYGGDDPNLFFMNYLEGATDDDPNVVAAANYNYYYLLTVI